MAASTMESIVVDPETGNIAVKTLIKNVMPSLHDASVLKAVNRMLAHNQLPKLSKRLLNGRQTCVATLDLCFIILDKMKGRGWEAWRQASGPMFKDALREWVEQVRASTQVQQPQPMEEQPAEGLAEEPAEGLVQEPAEGLVQEPIVEEKTGEDQEEEDQPMDATKTSTLQRALRSINIQHSVRVDECLNEASVIDVVKMLCPLVQSKDAGIMLSRALKKDADENERRSVAYDGNPSTPLADRVHYIKINGVGHVTPVADAKTIVEIIWLLPSRAAREFRQQSAETICRVLGGDLSLCNDIEQRYARLESTEEGRAYQSFMLDEQPASKKHRFEHRPAAEPFWFEHGSEEQKSAFISAEVNKSVAESKKTVVMTQLSIFDACKEKLESIGQFETREKIEYSDRIKDLQNRVVNAGNMLTAAEPAETSLAIACPIDESIDIETGKLIATHKLPPDVRGVEISICGEAARLGISVGDKAGQVGKLVKRLYIERYGEDGSNIPKRNTTFRGKPFKENVYYARDADLVEKAIRVVCGSSGASGGGGGPSGGGGCPSGPPANLISSYFVN